MARDATARLYDVDENTIAFQKYYEREKYDHGDITFQARPGGLIDLDKLHESVWATRLSGGTRSGLVRLEVTAAGYLRSVEGQWQFQVADSDAVFLLAADPQSETTSGIFDRLTQQTSQEREQLLYVTGHLKDWHGRWPTVLRALPPKPRTILVTAFEKDSN